MTDGFEQLQFQLREGEDCTRLSLHGELDVASAAQFIEQLSFVNQSGVAELTVDLSELSYIDPSGLSVLAIEQQRATANGMALHIAAPSDFVRQMLSITGLIDVLDVSPDEPGRDDGGDQTPTHPRTPTSSGGITPRAETETPETDVTDRGDAGPAPAGWVRPARARTPTRPVGHPGR